MSKPKSYYVEKLQINKDTMELALDNLKRSYTSYKLYNTPEYNKIYNNNKANVEKIFQDLYLLQNNLMNNIQSQNVRIKQYNKNINRIKGEFKEQKIQLREITDTGLAAKPRRKDNENEMKKAYAQLLLLGVGCLGSIFITYKFVKSY